MLYHKFGWAIWDLDLNSHVEGEFSQYAGCYWDLKFGCPHDVIFAKLSRTGIGGSVLVALSTTTGDEVFVIQPPVPCGWNYDFNSSDNTLVLVGRGHISSYNSSHGELLHERIYNDCQTCVFTRACANILL